MSLQPQIAHREATLPHDIETREKLVLKSPGKPVAIRKASRGKGAIQVSETTIRAHSNAVRAANRELTDDEIREKLIADGVGDAEIDALIGRLRS